MKTKFTISILISAILFGGIYFYYNHSSDKPNNIIKKVDIPLNPKLAELKGQLLTNNDLKGQEYQVDLKLETSVKMMLTFADAYIRKNATTRYQFLSFEKSFTPPAPSLKGQLFNLKFKVLQSFSSKTMPYLYVKILEMNVKDGQVQP